MSSAKPCFKRNKWDDDDVSAAGRYKAHPLSWMSGVCAQKALHKYTIKLFVEGLRSNRARFLPVFCLCVSVVDKASTTAYENCVDCPTE
jgi:hypothetical protein